MTELLFGVGIVIFFMTVGGAVLVGGHLLEELQIAGEANTDDESLDSPVRGRQPRR
jgi:hypothetical protein